ncbi:hypothetical protein BZL29_2499 [Mycobacterium kansasii]|uniref:von Willebrand factor type A domain protein n=1 Tax=Mycobacterium kansasii TaxID=1768 RepID=A0A1V3XL06_MYCKA|nr:hypothetical protein BZL29_2499 [Mycobacterium kansasii]
MRMVAKPARRWPPRRRSRRPTGGCRRLLHPDRRRRSPRPVAAPHAAPGAPARGQRSAGADAPPSAAAQGSGPRQECCRRHRPDCSTNAPPAQRESRVGHLSRVGCPPSLLSAELVHGARNTGGYRRRLVSGWPEPLRITALPGRLGLGPDWFRRQLHGEDIDLDAAVEARVDAVAGSLPTDAIYLDRLRRRRDLAVLLLLDISGSVAEPGATGKTVHEQQRAVAAALAVAFRDLGDRLALYAFHSQGRASVQLVPVMRFDDPLDAPRCEGSAAWCPGRIRGSVPRSGTVRPCWNPVAARRGGYWSWCPTGWPTTTATNAPTGRRTPVVRWPKPAAVAPVVSAWQSGRAPIPRNCSGSSAARRWPPSRNRSSCRGWPGRCSARPCARPKSAGPSIVEPNICSALRCGHARHRQRRDDTRGCPPLLRLGGQ